MVAAKARAAAAKVSEDHGITSRHRAPHGARLANYLQGGGVVGAGAAAAGGALALADAPHDAAAESGDRALVTVGATNNRVNGALVAMRPQAHQVHSLTFAQYREAHLNAKRARREGSAWGACHADEPEASRGRALAYRMRIDQLSVKMDATPIVVPPSRWDDDEDEDEDEDDDEDEMCERDENGKRRRRRSPSPPPEYDATTGQRTNTREQRAWDAWEQERRECVQELLQCDPTFKPPNGHRPLVKELRLYLPKNVPGYNFIGLIIGPRGNTQKMLEEYTGARIAVRGRGSEKQGRKATFQNAAGMDDELHVYITADTIEKGASCSEQNQRYSPTARFQHLIASPFN